MRLLLLQPSKGSCSIEQRTMLLGLAALLANEGGHLALSDDTTSGMLAHSRGVLLHRLASSRCDYGLWLDADTLVSPARVLEMARRSEPVIMWNYPVRLHFDVEHPPEHLKRIATYVDRMPVRIWTGQPLMHGGGMVWSEDDHLCEMIQAGFGACLMAPSAAQLMIGQFGSVRDWEGRPVSRAFDPHGDPNRCSEDIGFWRRFRSVGGRIWCDPEPYVTNGQSGGRYADEIAESDRLRSAVLLHTSMMF